MKYLTALYSRVGSIKNLARYFAVAKVSMMRSQASDRLKSFLHLADQIKLLEEEIQHLENQLKLRDRLLSLVSHDTRAPLGSVKSLLHLLAGKHLSQDELREVALNLNHQVEQLASFLENLMQWTRNHYDQIIPNKEDLLLRPLVMQTIELLSLLADRKRIRIHCFVTDNEMIYGDAEMIKIILRNLISNSIKFCEANDSIFVQAHQMPGGVIISVRDTGRGISKEKLEKLFHISNLSTHGTADEIGTGMGLVLCREFVEKLGGIIQASSEEGQGSCFEFTVPYVTKEHGVKSMEHGAGKYPGEDGLPRYP
jgi:signal transduction histidine kinase